MIKLENWEVVGWEHAIRGMRNPKNSHDKSDSCWCKDRPTCDNCYFEGSAYGSTDSKPFRCDDVLGKAPKFSIGNADHELMMKLRNAGTDHRKFMRMIEVYVDITAPLYWWKEFDTYKVGTVANSCSTMHKIHAKAFVWSDFSTEHLTDGAKQIMKLIIDEMNIWRYRFLAWDDIDEEKKERNGWTDKKDFWWQMIQLLPSSYNQKRTIMLSYEVLANMYKSRKAHKLDEWREFCKWIESLPYSELITGNDGI